MNFFHFRFREISSSSSDISKWQESGFSQIQATPYLLQNVSLEAAITEEHGQIGPILTPLQHNTSLGQYFPEELVDLELEYLFTHSPEALGAPRSQGSSTSNQSASSS